MRRILCHGAVHKGRVYRNVIVTLSDTGHITDVIPFERETSGTEAFNGVIVTGCSTNLPAAIPASGFTATIQALAPRSTTHAPATLIPLI